MLQTITITIILIIIYSMQQTVRSMLRTLETQDRINRELKEQIQNRDDFMCGVQETLNKHIKEENEIYELIRNFGKEE